MFSLKIDFKDGRWLVNGKRLKEMNEQERDFMNEFFKNFKKELPKSQEAINEINVQFEEIKPPLH